MRACFPVIVAADDVAVGKPDPSGYLQALRIISERAGRFISQFDVRASKFYDWQERYGVMVQILPPQPISSIGYGSFRPFFPINC